MDHIKNITAVKAVAGLEMERGLGAPRSADAKSDLLNDIWFAWTDFRVALKNEKGGQIS
jgi:hypothetical protein